MIMLNLDIIMSNIDIIQVSRIFITGKLQCILGQSSDLKCLQLLFREVLNYFLFLFIYLIILKTQFSRKKLNNSKSSGNEVS